jgi:3-oxoacyl-[acyl-carrier protein] reductase
MAVDKRLGGRVAIVTGSGRNIGRAIVLAFAAEGAKVVVNGYSDRAAVESVVAEAKSLGVDAIGVMADVGDPQAVSAMVSQAEQQLGPIDIAVSNVSIRKKQPFLNISVDEWNRTINSNLSSSFYMARAVLPSMKERRFGRLIHISGVDGFAAHLTDRVHNITCKAGVHAMAKALSMEFAPFGITANTVAPGHIDTERDWSQYGPKEEWVESRKQHIPTRSIGRVEDVAQACVYLAADSGSFITGQAIHVNGGQYMF